MEHVLQKVIKLPLDNQISCTLMFASSLLQVCERKGNGESKV